MNVPKTMNGCNYTNGYDKTMIKLYKWMWPTFTNGGKKNYTNGCKKII